MSSIVVTTPPAIEPVTLAEAKMNSRISVSEDDALVEAMITTAREWAEMFTRRAFITQTITWSMDGFPACGIFFVPRPPLQSVTSVKYYDIDGVQQTISSGDYQVDTLSAPGRVAEEPDYSWPSVEAERLNAVEMIYPAGYGDAASDVPERAKQAIKLLVGHWYENREDTVEKMLRNIPKGAEYLLYSLKGDY